jgi:hypothetical protein
VSLGIARLVVAAIVTGGTLLALGSMNSALALAVGAVLASAAAIALALGRPLGRTVRASRRQRTRLANNVTEKLTAMAAVQVHGQVPRERRRVGRQSRRLRDAMLARSRVSGALRAWPKARSSRAGRRGRRPPGSGRRNMGLSRDTIGPLCRRSAWSNASMSTGTRRGRGGASSIPSSRSPSSRRRPMRCDSRGRGRLEFDGVSLDGVLEVHAVANRGAYVVGPSGAESVSCAGARLSTDAGGVLSTVRPPTREAALPAACDRRRARMPALRGSLERNLRYRATVRRGRPSGCVGSAALAVAAGLPRGLETKLGEADASSGRAASESPGPGLLGAPGSCLDDVDAISTPLPRGAGGVRAPSSGEPAPERVRRWRWHLGRSFVAAGKPPASRMSPAAASGARVFGSGP